VIRVIGLLLGLGLILAAVLAGRVTGGAAPTGSAITVSMSRSGELQLFPAGTVLTAPDLHPGGPATAATGRVVVRNQTGRSLAVRLRAVPSLPDLDGLLWMDVAVERGPRLSSEVGALRRWSERPFVIRSGERRRISLRAWIPAGVRDGYQGRVEDVVLEAVSVPVGR
jgi:hypothetical protein